MQKEIYGICLETGNPIGLPRLLVKPWAKYCIEVARAREKRGLSV
jgi:DnaK suppressor protein